MFGPLITGAQTVRALRLVQRRGRRRGDRGGQAAAQVRPRLRHRFAPPLPPAAAPLCCLKAFALAVSWAGTCGLWSNRVLIQKCMSLWLLAAALDTYKFARYCLAAGEEGAEGVEDSKSIEKSTHSSNASHRTAQRLFVESWSPPSPRAPPPSCSEAGP